MTRYPGEVYYLPPDDAPGGDPKTRPHLLLSSCNDDSAAASLAFCSTQATEAVYGGANVLVNPAASHYRRSGLSQATYVYPCRLVPVEAELLKEIAGRVIDEMPEIRVKLGVALGIGTGSCIGVGPAAGSLRGAVVRLQESISEVAGFLYGLVATDPEYSRQRRFLNVIPIYDGDEFEPEPPDVLVEGTNWLNELGYQRAILTVGLVQSVYMRDQVATAVVCALDDAGMVAVDDGLREHFEL